MSDSQPGLTPRQALILTHVVSEYIATGHPVGSKTLVEAGVVDASSSTVRYELAELETRGLLGHPHTSAGRVPTDAGYRIYAEHLIEQLLGQAQLPIDLGVMTKELDAALRTTTEMLSHVTSLLAVISAPPMETTEIRHVEVLLLQPEVVMVVVISSTGGVTKKIFPFPSSVDPKLIEWAREYLNEQLGGVRIGARALAQRLFDPGLSPLERAFLEAIEPAFTELVGSDEQHIYVGGASRLLAEMRWADMTEINDLMHALEERVTLLGVLRGALESDRVYLRIGSEHEVADLRGVAMVAANYGLVTRNLGTVSLIGPTRMDYATAIRSVRGAASLLSDYVESVYEQ